MCEFALPGSNGYSTRRINWMFEVEFDKPISESNVSTSIYRTEFKIKIFPTYVVLSPSELFPVWKTIKIDVV